mgnify:CR=1 FL=1
MFFALKKTLLVSSLRVSISSFSLSMKAKYSANVNGGKEFYTDTSPLPEILIQSQPQNKNGEVLEF